MKKTLTTLAASAFMLGSTLQAETTETTLVVSGEVVSPTVGTAMAAGATLTNTKTGGTIVFDENAVPPISAPFDVTHGLLYKNYTLSGILPTEGNVLVLDFVSTYQYYPTVNHGANLMPNATVWNGSENINVDYIVFSFDDTENGGTVDFSSWYNSDEPITIIGRFKDGVEATGYIISDSCDSSDPATVNGGIVFFNQSMAPVVMAAEQYTPEPTTSTLSLMALAGLAVRRRRR